MTEDEAKTKWCPFVRFVGSTMSEHSAFSSRLEDLSPEGTRCIASACMAWRWEMVHDGSFNTTLTGPLLDVTERIPNFKPSERGFCGLAGTSP